MSDADFAAQLQALMDEREAERDEWNEECRHFLARIATLEADVARWHSKG